MKEEQNNSTGNSMPLENKNLSRQKRMSEKMVEHTGTQLRYNFLGNKKDMSEEEKKSANVQKNVYSENKKNNGEVLEQKKEETIALPIKTWTNKPYKIKKERENKGYYSKNKQEKSNETTEKKEFSNYKPRKDNNVKSNSPSLLDNNLNNNKDNFKPRKKVNNNPQGIKIEKNSSIELPITQGEITSAPFNKNKNKKGKRPIKILFLGGVNEIGKNMTAIEYGNDIIIIDAGNTFPDEEMPGVDLVVPDVSYLVENKNKIRAILLTHGHEDHIGGLPYLLKQINVNTPIYATQLTIALADNKIREHRLQNVDFRRINPGDKIKAGCFEVEFINVNHSIAGAVALAIRTPYGLIYHSGDFKIDMTPVAGEPIDLARIAQLGKEGVLLYMGESTNIERPGYTMSETIVGTTLGHLFSENSNRRLIIATFASNVHRLQQIIDLAVKYRRKVALSGRSMLNVVDAASKIGELTIPEGILVDVEKCKNYFDNEIVIVSTGSQGEPMSALTRMANRNSQFVTIGDNDTIIISASPIPGNEKMVYRVINNLYRQGAEVVYESLEKIHVSGHACQEEHKIIHTLLKPKFFIPVHGEYRHLKLHSLLAQELGVSPNNIILPDIGMCIELTDKTMKQGQSFPAGATIIDGTGSEDYSTSEVIKDRKKIATDGFFVIAISLSGTSIVGEPIIENRGFMVGDERDYEKEIKGVVSNAIAQYDLENGNKEGLSTAIQKSLKGYLYKKTKQSPLILTMINQI